MTPTATWCTIIAVVIVGIWSLFSEQTLTYDEQRVEPVCTDHYFVEHPEDETCNYWYVGSPAVGWAEPCPYTKAQHRFIDEDEDDPCPGHMTLSAGWLDCSLPYGHGRVPEVGE